MDLKSYVDGLNYDEVCAQLSMARQMLTRQNDRHWIDLVAALEAVKKEFHSDDRVCENAIPFCDDTVDYAY